MAARILAIVGGFAVVAYAHAFLERPADPFNEFVAQLTGAQP